MGCLFNILWHFPFFGFLFALGYAIFGVIMCCTVILMPLGLGWLQMAKFMLSPFSYALVSRSDYEAVTGKKQNEVYAAFSLVIRILYIPIGCLGAIFAIPIIVLEFVSIVGIPCAMVWTKLFKSIFNPVGKVCVPKAVGDEIERRKAADVVSRYTGQSASNNDNNSQLSDIAMSLSRIVEKQDAVKEVQPERPQIRTFDDSRLAEIVNNPAMYNAELVAQCRHEIEIRRNSESMMEKVAEFDDGKLREIMADTGMYAEELVYCCQKEYDRRAQVRREEQEIAQELARLEREKEAEAERIRREENMKAMKDKAIAVLKKVGIIAPVIAVVCTVIYLCSDAHRYKSAIKLQERGHIDKAVRKLSKINIRSKYYERAQYNLYLDYLELKDSLAAGNALVQAVRNGNWDVYEAYECYVMHFLNDDFPSDARSEKSAIELLELSPESSHWIGAGELYFQLGEYYDAYRIFSEHSSWSDIANGYIGIMYLYGLAGLEPDVETAYKYLSQAPNENPFLVHKGDLTLFLRKSNRSTYGKSFYDSIEAADRFYAMAVSEWPDDEAYSNRYKVTQKIIKTKEKHSNTKYWDRGEVFWDSYSFNNYKSSYNGEVMWYGGNYTRGAHGWGYFDFENKELNIGKFSYCKNDGLVLKIIPGDSGRSYAVFIGEFKNNVPVKGCYISENGYMDVGKFKPTSKYFELVTGDKITVYGYVWDKVVDGVSVKEDEYFEIPRRE